VPSTQVYGEDVAMGLIANIENLMRAIVAIAPSLAPPALRLRSVVLHRRSGGNGIYLGRIFSRHI